MANAAIYVRVSEVGDREGPSFGSPAEQEAAAREWCERNGFDVDEVVTELDVSGATRVDDRELGRLISRCEAGELDAVVVRFEDRFARDVIEGATALRRIEECGARLIATASGFDSKNLTPDKRAWFSIQMAFAQAQREKNREARLRGAQRAADRGVYLAARVPTGYIMDAERRITPDPATRDLIVELFEHRAGGESIRKLAAWLRESGVPITKTGVCYILRNRAYVGEATVPTERKGQTETRRNAHEPLITEDLWEQAQAQGGPYHPRNGRWATHGRLAGLVVCSGCGRRLQVHGGGKPGSKTAYYSCTGEGCMARVSIRVDRLDMWMGGVLQDCVIAQLPEVIRVLEGDDRHARALEAVSEARRELEEYVTTTRVSEIGHDLWIKGKEARAAALAVAQRKLSRIPRPKPVSWRRARNAITWHEAEPALDREHNARFIDRIIVRPVGRGRRVAVRERVEVWLVGADRPLDVASLVPAGDRAVMESLRKALTADQIAIINLAARNEHADWPVQLPAENPEQLRGMLTGLGISVESSASCPPTGWLSTPAATTGCSTSKS